MIVIINRINNHPARYVFCIKRFINILSQYSYKFSCKVKNMNYFLTVFLMFFFTSISLPGHAAYTVYGSGTVEISEADILAIPAGVTGSGNGTLDLKLFVDSQNEVDNSSGAFDGDNANTDVSVGGGGSSGFYDESYVTTAGELKNFYDLNFGPNVIDEIVLFLDLNETGGEADTNSLNVMDVVLNPETIQGDPNPSGDVLSSEQNAINQVYTLGSGSLIASLDPTTAPYNLPVNSQGAGFADYAIFTGIDPYSLLDSAVLLFNQSISLLNNGGETKFLSGTFSGSDIENPTPIPEPATIFLLGTGLVGVACVARRRMK